VIYGALAMSVPPHPPVPGTLIEHRDNLFPLASMVIMREPVIYFKFDWLVTRMAWTDQNATLTQYLVDE
jgi:hypothetical protein